MNLKPCPFCGSSAHLWKQTETYGHGDFEEEWYVSCVAKSCCARMTNNAFRGNSEEKKNSAISLWNKRPSEAEGQWEKRFKWLWDNATDGFHSPEGWWLINGPVDDEDLAAIDGYLAQETTSSSATEGKS